MSEHIQLETRDGIQVIRLCRAEKKNALTRAMYAQSASALKGADASDDIAVTVLFGQPGIFTSGNDIGDFLDDAEGRAGLGDEVIHFLRALSGSTKPIIAGVDGPAVGIGTTLLFHCDLVFASDRSVFSTPFLDLGLVPEAGSSLLMPRRLGYTRAFELLALGETFDAERMAQSGLINSLVPANELERVAVQAAARIASKPPDALAATRRLMKEGVAILERHMAAEEQAFAERMRSPEALEAFRAFMEKRPPNYRETRRKS